VPVACPNGYYGERPGLKYGAQSEPRSPLACTPCPPGSWCRGGERFPCPVGTYNAVPERYDRDLHCVRCDMTSAQSTTAPPNGTLGALSIDECICNVGFFDNATIRNATSGPDCKPCVLGLECQGRTGLTLQALPVRRGFWRPSSLSSHVQACPDQMTGCSSYDDVICSSGTSGCSMVTVRDEGGDLSCLPGLRGPFCLLCDSGFFANTSGRMYYQKATQDEPAQCRECRTAQTGGLFGTAAVIAAAVLLTTLVIGAIVRRLPQSAKTWLRFAWGSCRVKGKILLGFYMVAPKVSRIYDVDMPREVLQLLANFEIVTFDFEWLTSTLYCLKVDNYTQRLQLWMVLPIVLVLLIVLLSSTMMFFCDRRVTHSSQQTELQVTRSFLLRLLRAAERATPWILRVLFLLYPSVTNVAFSAWPCYTFDNGDQWLIADVGIVCGSDDHLVAINWAVAAVVIYPLGLLFGCALLLLAARGAIQRSEQTRLTCAISFLYQEYRHDCYWWEVMEMARRFLLVGLYTRTPPQGSLSQITTAALTCVVYLFVQMQISPFMDLSDDYTAKASSFCLAMYFACCTLYKAQEHLQQPEVVVLRSASQQRLVRLPNLTEITLSCAIGTVVFTAAILLIQVRFERERLRKEEQMSQARRLRYKNSSKAVLAPRLGSAMVYHVFLSHVWGTGQDQMRVVKQRLREMVINMMVFLDADDLQEIGDLEGYVDRSRMVLVYCSSGYFQSKNCLRELAAATTKIKPVIALVDIDESRGGLSHDEIHSQLLEAKHHYEKWGFGSQVPQGEVLYRHLFAHDPIEWNRLGHFQDVTMRLIAERVALPPSGFGSTTVLAELEHKLLDFKPPPLKKTHFHVFCSQHNPGALSLFQEVAASQSVTEKRRTHLPGGGYLRRKSQTSVKRRTVMRSIRVTTNVDELPYCEHCLVYLTNDTWTGGARSVRFAVEVEKAMELGLHLLLAHEMLGIGGQEARHACEFANFFANEDGATPPRLLHGGIYKQIAVPLKGGAWRPVSMVMMAQAICRVEATSLRESSHRSTIGFLSMFRSLTGTSSLPKLPGDGSRRPSLDESSATSGRRVDQVDSRVVPLSKRSSEPNVAVCNADADVDVARAFFDADTGREQDEGGGRSAEAQTSSSTAQACFGTADEPPHELLRIFQHTAASQDGAAPSPTSSTAAAATDGVDATSTAAAPSVVEALGANPRGEGSVGIIGVTLLVI